MTLRPLLRRIKSDLAVWLRTAFFTVTAVGGGLWLAHAVYFDIAPAIVTHPYFQLAAIRIRCDNDAFGPETIAFRAGLFAGTSLWQLDTGAAEAALEEPPWVEKAEVIRRFPNRVDVVVTERKPVAATPTRGGPYLVDDSGVVYRPEGEIEYPDVPYLTGWHRAEDPAERLLRLRTLLRVASLAERVGIRVSQVDIDEEGELWLFPEAHRAAVHLGQGKDLRRKLERLRIVLERLPQDGGALGEIDIGYRDRVVLRARNGQYGRLVTALADGVPLGSGGKDRG